MRVAAATQDIIDDDVANKRTGDVMAFIQEHSKQEDVESQLLDDYEKSTVRYLRALDETLTQLGDPQVTAVTRSSRT
ncbi:hypothetical protein WJ91_17830 [Burkholderia ubonensis]|nr:hypothetical protein WJ91_17830 [Burkholderia ubonensis]